MRDKRKNIRNSGFTPLEKRGSLTGFTLVELMISAAILLLVTGGALLTLTYCILLNESNNNLVTATNDAEFVLEQIKELAYDDISGYVCPELTNLNSENISVTQTPGAGIVEVTVNVVWTERQRERTFSLPTRIAQ